MPNKTQNYLLNQWVGSDPVLRTDFNEDNAKIDAALASKADKTALAALSQTVDTKASQSALTSLTNTVNAKASQTTLDALTATVATKCEIVMGTYVGDGNNYAPTPNSLTLGFRPKALLITTGDLFMRSYLATGESGPAKLTETGFTYYDESYYNINQKNLTYTYFALR